MTKILYIADIRSNVSNGRNTGHFVSVARMYQDLFREICNVKVAGGPIYQNYFSVDEIVPLPYNISGTSICDKWRSMRNCFKLFNEAKGQTIVLQQSSVVTSYLGIALFYHSNCRLLMIQYSKAGISSPIKRFLYNLAKQKIDGVICPNEEVGKGYGLPFCVVPDYIYTNTVFETPIPFTKRKYDFCIVGRIAQEKGVLEVARLFKDKPFKLLIAGRPQTELIKSELEEICKGAANIELHLGYIDDIEYDMYIRQSRYSILNYSGEYSDRSSGVVYDMIFRGTPVIGSRCKALRFIEEKSLGFVYDSLDINIFFRAISYGYYDELLNHIDGYLKSHQQHKKRLQNFVLSI